MDSENKFRAIAQRSSETGAVLGCIYLKKKNRPTKEQVENGQNLYLNENKYVKIRDKVEYPEKYGQKKVVSAKDEFTKYLANQFGLNYRFVPVSADHPANVKLRRQKGLEGTLGIISIAGFLFSILFLSGITGNVIGTTETNSLIGIISILIGLIAGFFYLKIRKKSLSERLK